MKFWKIFFKKRRNDYFKGLNHGHCMNVIHHNLTKNDWFLHMIYLISSIAVFIMFNISAYSVIFEGFYFRIVNCVMFGWFTVWTFGLAIEGFKNDMRDFGE